MVDWELVAKIAGGGLGATLVILAILCIVIWLVGLIMQRRNRKAKHECK